MLGYPETVGGVFLYGAVMAIGAEIPSCKAPRVSGQVGKHDEAWMVLKHIHDTNMRARGQPEKVFTVSLIRLPRTAERG